MFNLTRILNRDGGPEVSTLDRQINRLFTEALGGLDWQYRGSTLAAWVPPVDVMEDADSIRITAELAGVRPEDVKISVEGNVLTISGTKQQNAEEKTEKVHRYERTYGAFERTFTLPTTVDAGTIKAACQDGVLTVTMPKVEKAKPRQIPVEGGR
jgi:HSP20 family protein